MATVSRTTIQICTPLERMVGPTRENITRRLGRKPGAHTVLPCVHATVGSRTWNSHIVNTCKLYLSVDTRCPWVVSCIRTLPCVQGRRTGPSNAVCPHQPRHSPAPPSGDTIRSCILLFCVCKYINVFRQCPSGVLAR